MHTYIYTHIYIYIYTYICICVCIHTMVSRTRQSSKHRYCHSPSSSCVNIHVFLYIHIYKSTSPRKIASVLPLPIDSLYVHIQVFIDIYEYMFVTNQKFIRATAVAHRLSLYNVCMHTCTHIHLSRTRSICIQ